IRRGRDPTLHEIHPDCPPTMERAVLVDTDDVTDSAREKDFDRRCSRRSDAGDDHSQLLWTLTNDPKGVQQRRQDNHGGPMLIIVEDRDLEVLTEPLFDLEAAWRGDVLEVDAPEDRGEQLHGLNDLVAVLGGQADREGVDAGKLLEEHRLAFHHRQRRLGTVVAQTDDRSAGGHDGYRVVLHREGKSTLTVVPNGQTHPGHTRGVSHGEVVPGADGNLVFDLDLPAQMHQKRAIRDIDDPCARDVTQAGDDLLAVDAISGFDRDVPHDPISQGLDEVDRPDIPTRVTDRRSDPSEHPGAVLDLDTEGDAVTPARGDCHTLSHIPSMMIGVL